MTDKENLKARIAHLEDRLETIEGGYSVEDESGKEWSINDLLELGLTRRQALKSLGALAIYGGSIWGAVRYASQDARAATDQVGTSGQRVDLFADSVDSNSINTDEAVINNLGGRGESNSTQSIPSTTATVIALDAADFEDDASNIVDVDTSNDKLVAKKSGVKYDIKASCKFAGSISDGDRFKMTIEVNGTAIAEYDLPGGGGAFPGTALADVKELSAGDEITATVFQGSASSKDLTADERNSVAATVEG